MSLRAPAPLVLSLLLLPTVALATAFTWDIENAPYGGPWNDSGCWVPNGVPDGRDVSADVYLDNGSVQIPTCSSMSFTLNILNLGESSPLSIDDNMMLVMSQSPSGGDPRIRTDSRISISGTTAPSALSLSSWAADEGDPELTIEGVGDIWLGNGASISSPANGTILLDSGIEVYGRGANLLPAVLAGPITCNGGEITAVTGRLKITGPLTLQGGAFIDIEPEGLPLPIVDIQGLVIGGTLWPGEGTVEFYYGGLQNVAVGAGALEVVAAGYFQKNITLSEGADLLVRSQQSLRLIRTSDSTDPFILNMGTIRLDDGTGYGASLYSDEGAATFGGNGRLVLAGGSSRLYATGTGSYVNGENHTIEGKGQIIAPLLNHGTILVTGNPFKIVSPLSGEGNLRAQGSPTEAAVLEVYAPVQTGHLDLDALSRLMVYYSQIVQLHGHFSFAMQDESAMDWYVGSILEMNGGGVSQGLEVGGTDLGAVAAGLSNNFQIRRLRIRDEGTRVFLKDSIDNGNRSSAEVVYVSTLEVLPGATLNLNTYRMYTYHESVPYRVMAGDGDKFGGGTIIDQSVSAAPQTLALPSIRLRGPAPNPFNAMTCFLVELEEPTIARLAVYSLDGRLVRTLLDGPCGALREVSWDGRDGAGRGVASGTYFCRLEAGGESVSKRAVLVK